MDEEYDYLARQWKQLITDYGVDPKNKVYKKTFNWLIGQYNRKDRFYHNITHLSLCIMYARTVTRELLFPNDVLMALWFHDSIYDSHAVVSSNEGDSALCADHMLRDLGIPEDSIERIIGYIMDTEHKNESLTHDGAFVQDIDLLQIATINPITNSKNIRKEYSWVDHDLFVSERKKILKRLISTKYFFHTDHYRHADFERIAQNNIMTELQYLGVNVVIGGTFDLLHDGHKKLLRDMLNITGCNPNSTVTIGVTDDEMSSKKSHPVQPFDIRCEQIMEYILNNIRDDCQITFEILPLSDPVGNAGTGDYDILVASAETSKGAHHVNKIRMMNGLSPLVLYIVDVVKDNTGERISSTRLRQL